MDSDLDNGYITFYKMQQVTPECDHCDCER